MNLREEINRRLLKVAKEAGLKVETRIIPFTDNDVPRFLQELDLFE